MRINMEENIAHSAVEYMNIGFLRIWACHYTKLLIFRFDPSLEVMVLTGPTVTAISEFLPDSNQKT